MSQRGALNRSLGRDGTGSGQGFAVGSDRSHTGTRQTLQNLSVGRSPPVPPRAALVAEALIPPPHRSAASPSGWRPACPDRGGAVTGSEPSRPAEYARPRLTRRVWELRPAGGALWHVGPCGSGGTGARAPGRGGCCIEGESTRPGEVRSGLSPGGAWSG